MPIKAAVFDMDGTLLNTLGDLAAASNFSLRQMGLPEHPEESYRHFVGDGARVLCLRMLPAHLRDDETAARARVLFDARYQEHMFDRTAPYDGIPELLEQLSAQGLGLGIVSNKPDGFVQLIAQRYFPGVFQAVSGPRNGLLKPDPSGVEWVLEALGARPCEALYIGDSGVDMRTARSAGAHGCGVLWGFRSAEELRESGAEFLVSAPSEIAGIVAEMP